MTITESTDAQGEYWIGIPGHGHAYEVSTSGRVRSRDRVNINRNGVRRVLRGKILSASLDGEGYPQVGLLRGGTETKRRVHRIVAEAFVKNRNGLPLVDHVNRIRSDCRVSNLRWASHADNRANSSQTPARFYDGNDAAMADIEACAARERAKGGAA